MKKKTLAFIMAAALLFGAFAFVTAAQEIYNPQADDDKNVKKLIDFEDFSTDMQSDEIAQRLGWDNWDSSIAELVIIETVWLREVHAKKALSGDKAKAALGMTDMEWNGRNNRIVDVALLSTIEGYEKSNMDYSSFSSFGKKLVIVPKKVNQSITGMKLLESANASSGLFVELELTPWAATTARTVDESGNVIEYGSPKNNATVPFSKDSSVTVSLNGDVDVIMGLNTQGIKIISYGDTDVSKTFDQWYRGNMYEYCVSEEPETKGNGYLNERTYTEPSEAAAGTYWCLYDGSGNVDRDESTTGFTFSFRTKVDSTAKSIESFVRANNAKIADENYSNAWNQAGRTISTDIADMTDEYSVTLNYNNSGASFCIDNIKVLDKLPAEDGDGNGSSEGDVTPPSPTPPNTDNGSDGDADTEIGTPITVSVNGKSYNTLSGMSVLLTDIQGVKRNDNFAIVTHSDGTKKLYSRTDMIKMSSNMKINTYSVTAKVNEASMRAGDLTGIRFVTTLENDSVTVLNELKAMGIGVELGTLITPRSYAEKAGACTFDALDKLGDGAYVKAIASLDALYDNDTGSFAGSLVNLREEHYSTEYVGVGYVKISFGEDTLVIYAEESHATASKLAAAFVEIYDGVLKKYIVDDVKKYLP